MSKGERPTLDELLARIEALEARLEALEMRGRASGPVGIPTVQFACDRCSEWRWWGCGRTCR